MLSILRFILMGLWSAILMMLTPFLIPIFMNREIPMIVGRVLFAPGLLLFGGIKLKTTGVENVPLDRPVIFISNHCSHFDIACLFRSLPRNIHFVAKKELLWVPFLGFNLWATGHIIIDRSNRKKAIESLRKAAQKIKGGKCVTLYPEGTRSSTGEMGSFKKGAFHLAIDADVEVVPIYIDGTFNIWPKGSWKIKPGTVHVNIGAPIHACQYSKQNVNQFIDDSRKAIVALKPAKDVLPSALITPSFFEALAHLFYAISVADKVLVLDEKKAIFNEITNYWMYTVDGNSSSEMMFAHLRQLINEATESAQAFDSFKAYYSNNSNSFTVETKKAIFDSVNIIAGAYSNKNKSELGVIAQLQLLFS